MDKIAELDLSYEQMMNHLPELIPDGVLEVDLPVLQKLGLLTDDSGTASHSLTRYFHVVEAKEKITLFNDQFVVWVVPEKIEDEPTTLVLIAINLEPKLKLELAFVTAGIYNTSRLVLRIIEKLLSEIQETEDLITHFEDASEEEA